MRLSRGGKPGDRPRTAPNVIPESVLAPVVETEAAESVAPVKMRRFRAPFGQPRLSAEAATRQGTAVRLALGALPAADVTSFLNTEHSELGGRPIDLAVASDEGLAAVAAMLETQRTVRA